MAVSLSVIAAKDSAGTAIAGGLQAQDKSGAGTGPFTLGQILIDGVAGTNMAQITATNALKVDGSAVTQPVSLTSTTVTGTVAVTQSGAWSLSANQSINNAQINGVTPLMGNGVTGTGSQRVTIASDNTAFSVNAASTLAAETTKIIGNVGIKDGTSTLTLLAASSGSPAATVVAVPVSIRDALSPGQATMANSTPAAISSNQTWPTGMSPRGISAAFSTLTRPANTTAYTAADSISDNATAGSVTALTATLSDTNDDPVTLTEILVTSTDTGLAGKRIRAYLYNSDPTASTGVGGGDNAAFANKKAGYIGCMSGVLETGFSDGTVGRLVPSFNDGAAASTPNASAGGFIVTKPTSGAKTLFIQFQAIDGFTPSASSTTIIATARGFQGRAS